MSKKIISVLKENEFITHTSKASLTKMLPHIAGTVVAAGKFVATGIPSMNKSRKKIDRGLLEVILCLTNKRLMIWKTTWYGSPKEIWLSIDLDQIEKVTLKFTKVFWKLPSVKITLFNKDNVGLWSAKIHKKRTVQLIESLQKQIKENNN